MEEQHKCSDVLEKNTVSEIVWLNVTLFELQVINLTF